MGLHPPWGTDPRPERPFHDRPSTEEEIRGRQQDLVKGYLRQYGNVDPPGPGYYPPGIVVKT